MATVNIRRDVKDTFYRYKMPRLLSKVEGKGNGIKTVIPNMSDISRSLSRPPTYPTKYFGFELGAQVNCDGKNDRYIVNGAHDAARLQQILDGFIQRYVLCPSCQNPETDLIITKTDEIIMDCKACGKRNPADNRHKLATFITRNPPPPPGKGGKKGKHAGTNTPPGSAVDEDGNPIEPVEGDEDDDDDDELTRRLNAEAAELPAESAIAAEEWSEDTSAEAVARRMQELAVKTTVLGDDDDDDDEGNKYEAFGQWLDENTKATDDDIYKKAEELGVANKHKAVQVLVQCIFDETIVQQIPKRTKLLQRFGTSEKHQRAILGGIERLVGLEYKDKLMTKVPIILKKIYDADLVEEEVILKWGEKPSKRYVDRDTSKAVKKAAETFLNWLRNAAEEETDEEDD
ncbi:domain found in IF2B/IF5-domain-containing protein [Jimgerdemannia flammicorona]|uniref:Domain found in IF2B/IF5-domain-containing protein n=2 Tax=Jimgerdemannia flammicorona TaxID=994334 RepID=A0A433ABJ1_9FUNG|nr:domain found in IF2B/IF5-domain-containing protein [Jimgerdemannia flammicorona]RUS26824.1 domain found in IF2B/IF5-domain-containing protein [Jimgerdemannia flammicorona]